MSAPILAILSREEIYTNKLAETFLSRKELSFEVYAFTNPIACCNQLGSAGAEILLVSERDYTDAISALDVKCMIILDENASVMPKGYPSIAKYQSADKILRETFAIYAKCDSAGSILRRSSGEAQIIGFYTPVHKCLQTGLSMTMAGVLAQEARTLYLNFESFSGFESFLGNGVGGTMTDLLYYYRCDREKLAYHMESMICKIDGLDFVPPGNAFPDYFKIDADEWVGFIHEVAEKGGYKYVVLDLSEQVGGLFEVLSSCDKIYMLQRDDSMSAAKTAQYELLLNKLKLDEVTRKTRKCTVPQLQSVKVLPPQFAGCELAAFARDLIMRDLKNSTEETY